jgi:hypothetical protein
MRMRWLTTLLLAAGCQSGSFAPLADQGKAEQIVWRETYGMTNDAPPPVEWITANGWWCAQQDRCNGETFPDRVQVACGDDCKQSIAFTAYAHELLHYRCYLKTGDLDPLHFREDWSLVDRAKDAMEAAGLEAVWRH